MVEEEEKSDNSNNENACLQSEQVPIQIAPSSPVDEDLLSPMSNLSLEASSVAVSAVNNPEVEVTDQQTDQNETIIDSNTGLILDHQSENSTNQHQEQVLMNLHDNFSQVIAEAVQDIITRYNSNER